MIALTLSLAAGLGGAVWASPPSTTSTQSTQFRLENATVQRATGTPKPTSGTHIGMWWNRSTATTTVEGPGRLRFSAVGSYCDGWPMARIVVDDKSWWHSYVVNAKRYGAYAAGPTLPEGTHEVRIELANDRYRAGQCDRNLYLADVWVEAPEDTPRPPATPDPTIPEPTSPEPTIPEPTTPEPTTPEPASPEPSTPEPSEPPDEQPGPETAGVPDGTPLKVHHGDLVVKTDGAVIDGLDVRGFVNVQADDVTIRRSIIRGRDPGRTVSAMVTARGQQGLRIERSSIVADRPSPYLDGVKGRDFTLDRVRIARVVDSVMIVGGQSTSILDSWLHQNTHFDPDPVQPDGKSHDDSIQIEGGRGITITGNRIEGATNAAIMMTQNVERTAQVRVADNQIAGGACSINLADKGRGPIHDVRIERNEFGQSRLERCAVIAPRGSIPSLSDNWYGADGSPVRMSNGG